MSVSVVQSAILARAEEVLGANLHYEALPASGDLDAQLATRYRRLPAVFVTFLGGDQIPATGVLLDANFVVLVMTGGVREADRRDGNARSPGAIPILERLIPALHAFEVPGIGGLTLVSVANLFAPAFDEKGLTLYSAAYRIRLPLELTDDPAWQLAPLETIHADWVADAPVDPSAALPLADGNATASDTVTLPQGVLP